MSHGQFGFSPTRSKESRRARARATIACWRMGRRHLVDHIDHALHALAADKEPTGINRRHMVVAVRRWLKDSPHLPQDLQAAILLLMPEAGQVDFLD